ncbi:MAG: hypothetical protein N4A45_08260 [Flavobacteriales bacterium]|jgi:hypothetical protein|nr:hypothetical protein [Flavobacteriales bacterium]
MAIWQYQLTILPKSAVVEKFGEVPNTLFIDKKAWKDYWETVKFDNGFPAPEFEDAQTIKWWKSSTLNIQETMSQIDKLVKRDNWSNDKYFISWKGDSEKEEDNDCHIALNNKTLEISEFQFRTDLRNLETAKKFMEGMISICIKNNLLLMNTDGVLFEPKMEIIFEDIKKSSAIEFLTNPREFIEEAVKNEDNRFRFEPTKQSIWSKIKNFINK